MNTVQRFKQRKIVKAQLGTLLKKGWNWLSNSAQIGAIAESPAIMTASGWRVDRNGKAKQDQENTKEVKQLRNNLTTIGEAGATAPTLVGDVEGLYNVVRHPVQTYNTIKEGLSKIPLFFKSNNGNITENFLKFVGGSGKPTSQAVPKTQAQKEMYQMLEQSGVDMSKIGIEDINKALELREQQLFASGKRFSYQEPVTHNTEIIRDIDNGQEVAYIGLRKPYLTNDKGFAEDAWIQYSSNPRNKGLKIDMVENLSQTKPGFNKTYHEEQERLTNSAIQVGKQQGYEGVVSGESLLSPEKTVKMYPKYKHKRVIDQNGTYNWQNHNSGLPQQSGPVYMLEQPTYKTVVKSKIFDPKIIDSNGKMKIDWKKGASMFTAWGVPITIGGYTYATNTE